MENKPIITSVYAGNVQFYSKLAHYPALAVDWYQHYEKQTFRNRCQIATANGVMDLIIPIIREKGSKTIDKDIKIANDSWQKIHWGALEAAYRQSPFFMYYEDDIRPFYTQKFTYLVDYNMALQECLCNLLPIPPAITPTSQYVQSPTALDLRHTIHPKHAGTDAHFECPAYYQVFEQKNGFIPNLSVYDLLFNMGTEAILVLQKSFIP